MRVGKALIFAISLMFVAALAQEATGVSVAVVTAPDHGTYLVDGDGRSLYVFTADPKGESTCVDECALNWPPLVAQAEATAGAGVAGSLIGAVTRPDGVEQLTYSGSPLYYYAQDTAPGDVRGQGINDAWYLVSPFGAAIVPKAPAPTEATDTESLEDAELAAVLEAGSTVFSQFCAACHGARGDGGVGPRLAGGKLGGDRRVIRQVLNGGSHMPGFGPVLDDEQVAAVVTFIRKSWDNDFPSVTPEGVVGYR